MIQLRENFCAVRVNGVGDPLIARDVGIVEIAEHAVIERGRTTRDVCAEHGESHAAARSRRLVCGSAFGEIAARRGKPGRVRGQHDAIAEREGVDLEGRKEVRVQGVKGAARSRARQRNRARRAVKRPPRP